MQQSQTQNPQYSRAERALINAYRAGDTKAVDALAAHLRQAYAGGTSTNQTAETSESASIQAGQTRQDEPQSQRFVVTAPDGKRYRVTAPLGATEEEAMNFAKSSLSSQSPKANPKPDPDRVRHGPWERYARDRHGPWERFAESPAPGKIESPNQAERDEPSFMDQAKAIGQSALAGLSDPFFGASRLVAETGGFVSSFGGIAPNFVSDFFDDESRQYQRHKAGMNQATDEAREKAGFEGLDATRLTTNIVNPINALPFLSVVSKARQGATGLAGLAQLGYAGAKSGALAATVQPADDESEVPYATQKLGQVLMGATLGGLSAPTVSVLGGSIARQVKRAQTILNKPDSGKVLADALEEAGVRAGDIGEKELSTLRSRIDDALRTGKSVDPAAMVREQDFAALGMTGTKGQALRDPAQFASEKNLAGVDGIGSPLLARLSEQNQVLNSRLLQHADGASDPYIASQQVLGRLEGLDREMGQNVSALYKAAARHGGADLPTTGLAQDAARIIGDFREKIPGGVVARLRSYGFLDGKQTKQFDFDEAESLLKLINSHGSNVDKAEKAALDQMREAVKRAIVAGADDGGPYSAARKAASDRFRLHDAVPALKKVSQGDAEPDAFIEKYVMRASVSEVKGMAGLLDEATKQEVKSQIGDHLRRAAFGHDFANDAPFRVNGYNNALRKLGPERLRAYFSPDEVEELMRIGRVAHYKDIPPANAAVNHSSTASALHNLLRATGGGLSDAPLLNVATSIGRRHRDIRAVQDALAGGLTSGRPDISDSAQLVNSMLVSGSAISSPLLANRANRAQSPLLRGADKR